jgi:hypothetical protein
MAEAALRNELVLLRQQLQTRDAELQRLTLRDAEVAHVVAEAQEELSRMSEEETHATMAMGLVQRHTALRASQVSQQMKAALDGYHRESAAVQQLQHASAQQQQILLGSAQQLRTEFSHAETVFGELRAKDLVSQQELQHLQAVALSGEAIAANFGQYELAVQSAFANMRGELHTAVATVSQQQHHVNALIAQNNAAQHEIRMASEQRSQLENGVEALKQQIVLRDEERTREFKAAFAHQQEMAESALRNLSDGLMHQVSLANHKYEKEAERATKYYQDLKQLEHEWNSWGQTEQGDEAMSASATEIVEL